MRAKVYKRKFPLEQPRHDVPTTSKMSEVTVIQHYPPNPMRKTMGNFPKVRYSSKLPEEDEYRQLQSVFKFVDNFLTGANVNEVKPQTHLRSRDLNRKKSQCKPIPKSVCIPGKILRHVDRDAKNVVRKPISSLRGYGRPVDKLERVKTNVNNIMKKNSVRVSLKSPHLFNCQLGNNENCGNNLRSPVGQLQYVSKTSPLTSDSNDYIKHLKHEIKKNKAHLCNQKTQFEPSKNSPRDDYVRKLKDELTRNKAKCVDEDKNVIQDLHNEILSYRLQAKTKYSSSCSNIHFSDQNFVNLDSSDDLTKSREEATIEKSPIGESPKTLSVCRKEPGSSPKESPRTSDLCKTLWQSKISLPSSTEFFAFPVTQEVYFEEKLEEANTLIERVRATLRDIGMGIPKIQEQKKETGHCGKPQLVPKKKKCVKSCSYHGKSNQKRMEDEKNEQDVKPDTKSREVSEECKSRSLNTIDFLKNADANLKIIVSNLKKQQLEEKQPASCCSKTKEKKKCEIVLVPDTSQSQKMHEELIKPEKDKEKEDLVIITIQAAKKTVFEELSSESVDKLLCIKENCESAADTTNKNVDSKTTEDLRIPVTRMERASSPINIPEEAKSKQRHSDNTVNDVKVLPENVSLARNSLSLDELKSQVTPIVPKSWTEDPLVSSENKRTKKTSTPESGALSPTVCSDEIIRTKINRIINERGSNFRGESLNSKDIHSLANAIRSPSEKTTKLSIQVMPTLSIRGGLVMQKTLHLSIKPTGSITNDVGGTHSNVGYQEIDANAEQKQDPELTITDKGTCPDDCKSSHGMHCKSKSTEPSIQAKEPSIQAKEPSIQAKESSIQGSVASQSKETSPSVSKQTLVLYKSLLDEKLYEDQRKPESLQSTDSEETSLIQVKGSSQPSSPHSVDSIQDLKYLPETLRTPWQLGFYKTKATQYHDEHDEHDEHDKHPVAVFVAPRSPVIVSKANSLDFATSQTKDIEIQHIRKLIGAGTDSIHSYSSNLQASPSSSRRSISSNRMSITQVLGVLEGETTGDNSRDTLQRTKQAAKKIPAKEVIKVQSKQKPENESDFDTSSSSSGSNSSYVIQGNKANLQRDPYRSHPSNDDANIRVTKSAATNRKPKESNDKPILESAPAASSSKKSSGTKTDISIQVSLEASSSDDSSSEEEAGRSNTITRFIKGLTGTSREDINKLRSSPSFPKTELSSWSKGVLKTLSRERSRAEVVQDIEVEVDSLEYNALGKTDDTSIDAETTTNRKDLQKRSSTDSAEQDGKKDKDNIVMSLQVFRDRSGEGDDRVHVNKRHLPFYRRVLDRIIDPSNKKMMKKSLSEPYPLDESVSEGEIRTKSRSIGEVNPYKYLERKRFGKSELKYLKHQFGETSRKGFGEKSIRVARQRTQYNNWVTYYLQKQQDKCIDDSGSTSAFSSRS